eukprot:12095162-Heterocapsa_arctica.AAC.1
MLHDTRKIFNQTTIKDNTEGRGFHSTTLQGCKGIREGALRPQLWTAAECAGMGVNETRNRRYIPKDGLYG